jgi:hypothetical protein
MCLVSLLREAQRTAQQNRDLALSPNLDLSVAAER